MKDEPLTTTAAIFAAWLRLKVQEKLPDALRRKAQRLYAFCEIEEVTRGWRPFPGRLYFASEDAPIRPTDSTAEFGAWLRLSCLRDLAADQEGRDALAGSLAEHIVGTEYQMQRNFTGSLMPGTLDIVIHEAESDPLGMATVGWRTTGIHRRPIQTHPDCWAFCKNRPPQPAASAYVT